MHLCSAPLMARLMGDTEPKLLLYLLGTPCTRTPAVLAEGRLGICVLLDKGQWVERGSGWCWSGKFTTGYPRDAISIVASEFKKARGRKKKRRNKRENTCSYWISYYKLSGQHLVDINLFLFFYCFYLV